MRLKRVPRTFSSHSIALVSYKIGAFVFSAPSPNLTGSLFIPVKIVAVQLSSVLMDVRKTPMRIIMQAHITPQQLD